MLDAIDLLGLEGVIASVVGESQKYFWRAILLIHRQHSQLRHCFFE
jgi:hypothetical protein